MMKGDMKMKNKFVLYRILIVLGLVCGGCNTAFSIPYNASPLSGKPSDSWGYRPVYNNASAMRYQMKTDAMPAFDFQSTSSYITTEHNASAGIKIRPGLCRSPWDGEDDPGEEEIGVVENPQPIGEPTILFLFALLFLFVRIRSRFRIHFLSRSPSRF